MPLIRESQGVHGGGVIKKTHFLFQMTLKEGDDKGSLYKRKTLTGSVG